MNSADSPPPKLDGDIALVSVRPPVRLSTPTLFWAFHGDCMERMAQNVVCLCILITSRTDSILITFCLYSSYLHNFNVLNGSILELWGIFRTTHGRNGQKRESKCTFHTFCIKFCECHCDTLITNAVLCTPFPYELNYCHKIPVSAEAWTCARTLLFNLLGMVTRDWHTLWGSRGATLVPSVGVGSNGYTPLVLDVCFTTGFVHALPDLLIVKSAVLNGPSNCTQHELKGSNHAQIQRLQQVCSMGLEANLLNLKLIINMLFIPYFLYDIQKVKKVNLHRISSCVWLANEVIDCHFPTRMTCRGCIMLLKTVHGQWNVFGNVSNDWAERTTNSSKCFRLFHAQTRMASFKCLMLHRALHGLWNLLKSIEKFVQL